MRMNLGNSETPIKHNIIGILEEERVKEAENLLEEVIAEKLPNLGKETDIQIQEVRRSLNKINPRRSTSRHSN